MAKEPRNQTNLVEQKLKDHASARMTTHTEKLRPPGIEGLHLKSIEEISQVLGNIIKSRQGITSLTYHIGQYVEVTSQSDLSI